MFVSSLFYWTLLLSQQNLRALYVSDEDLTGEIGIWGLFFSLDFFVSHMNLNTMTLSLSLV